VTDATPELPELGPVELEALLEVEPALLEVPDDEVVNGELEPVDDAVALCAFAARTGSWPVTSCAKITTQRARNSVTATVVAARRSLRTRSRRSRSFSCARALGSMASVDMREASRRRVRVA
jgi:hypothetical protein